MTFVPAGVGSGVPVGLRVALPGVGDPVEGETYVSGCEVEGTDGQEWSTLVYDQPDAAPPAPTPADVALEAYAQVPLVAPQVNTSPPVGGDQLVGFPTWLWVDDASWQVFEATAEVPGLAVTVTATPTRVAWDMGDGNQVTCDGPGTAWVEGGPEESDCEHVYQFVSRDEPGGTYTVTATITWAVTWEATGAAVPGGATGTLADATRTGTADLVVAERQAVIHYGSGSSE